MYNAVGRAVRVTLLPGTEWLVILREAPDLRGMTAFVLLLACIPAASWSLGLLLFGDGPSVELASTAHRGAIVYLGSVLSIGLLALSFLILAPVFGVGRNWGRTLQVAVYSSAPVLLAGFLLIIPDLVIAILLAAFQSFYLQYVGVQHLLGVKEDQAAEFVALCIVVLMIASTILGAFGGWIGVM